MLKIEPRYDHMIIPPSNVQSMLRSGMKLWLLAVLVVARACTVLGQNCQADQPRSDCGKPSLLVLT